MFTRLKSRTTITKGRAAVGGRRVSQELVIRRLPRRRPPTCPGEMLLEEFGKPLAITQSELASRLGISFPRSLSDIERLSSCFSVLRPSSRIDGVGLSYFFGSVFPVLPAAHTRQARSSCRRRAIGCEAGTQPLRIRGARAPHQIARGCEAGAQVPLLHQLCHKVDPVGRQARRAGGHNRRGSDSSGRTVRGGSAGTPLVSLECLTDTRVSGSGHGALESMSDRLLEEDARA